MKYYLGDKFLFVEMNQRYTHCVVEGEDRIICCLKTFSEAQRVCADIKLRKYSKIRELQELFETGHAYSSEKKTAFGLDPRELYPTAGLLRAAIRRMQKTAESVRVLPLTVVP